MSGHGVSAPIPVIYISGSGRSGSTVLDTLLGNHAEIEGLGEVTQLLELGWLGGERCACGRRVPDCRFWSAVRARWDSELGAPDLADVLARQRRIERLRNWRQLAAGRRSPAGFERYAEEMRALFAAIRSVSGKPILLDSSKRPARALALSRVPGLDLRVIHLVRDGRGVAWSLQQALARDERGGVARARSPRPVLRTAVFWAVVNHFSERMCRRLGPAASIRVRYEDFAADPVTFLAPVGRITGVDLGEVARSAAAGEPFAVGHTVAGSRLRMAGSIRLRLDERWRQNLSQRQRMLFRLVAGRYLKRYGYRA